jgi:hypothetical protein
MKRMLRLLTVCAALCLMAPQSRADQGAVVEDVTIWWSPWWRGKPGPINLFVNGDLVGSGREGMEAVLEIVRKLPRGTSVVWGPNVRNSWSGPPGEKSTVPDAFPDLWGRFLQATRDNGLVVSSSFYGGYSGPRMESVATVVAAGTPRGAEDVLVRWDFVPPNSLDIFVQEKPVGRDAQGVLAVKQVLESLPADRTTRFVLAESRPRGRSIEESFAWHALVDGTYRSTLARVIQRRRLRAVIEKPEQFMLASEKAAHRATLTWCNYDYFRETPHAEVVYLVNGKVMGLGDAGMDGVLAFLRAQPNRTLLSMPQFTTSRLTPDIDQDRVPFPRRRDEFDAVVQGKGIDLDYVLTVPQSHHQADSIESMASLGRIVRDGAIPKRADLVLSWKNFSATDARADPGQAVYTLNGDEVATGVTGFLAVVKRIDALPNGAVLRLEPVSIRTTGPFPCPIMLAGYRHFARTGREPYHHLIEILAEVVKRKGLQVELIPNEGKSELSCLPL